METKNNETLSERLKRSSKDVGELYPILIDEDTGEVLDGRSRQKANPSWRTEKIKTESEEQRLRIKYHANWHRKDFNRSEALTEIAKRTGWRGLKPFAEFLDVSEKTVSKYLPQIYKDSVQSNNRSGSVEVTSTKKVEKAVQIGDALAEAIEKLDCGEEKKEEISQKLESVKKELKIIQAELPTDSIKSTPDTIIENWLKEIEWKLSLWECENERPEGYGDKSFHGNCSPTLICGLLKRYSDLSDSLIVDPMAGSGTFVDVALMMGYQKSQIRAFDIRPLRPDIIDFADAEKLPLENSSVDFVFAHFPYWKLIEYSDNDEDLSRMRYEEFLVKSDKIFQEIKRVLKNGRYFALMIGNMRQDGLLDLESEMSFLGSRQFRLWDKIVRKIRTWTPETLGQRMGLAVARATEHNYSVVNHDTILVFRRK